MRFVLVFLSAALSCTSQCEAQSYPAKPVRILVGFAPGGSTDLTARLFAQELNKLWNVQMIVDNRPGASGLIAGELTAKAAPDGYTWLVSPQTTTVVAPLIFKKVPFDPMKDFTPVAVIGSTPQLLVLHPSLPLAHLKSSPCSSRTMREISPTLPAASARLPTWRVSF